MTWALECFRAAVIDCWASHMCAQRAIRDNIAIRSDPTWNRGAQLDRGARRPLVGVAERLRRINRKLLGSRDRFVRSEEQTSELQSLMRISYAVFCLTKKLN